MATTLAHHIFVNQDFKVLGAEQAHCSPTSSK
jgi:hypothetical protein